MNKLKKINIMTLLFFIGTLSYARNLDDTIKEY